VLRHCLHDCSCRPETTSACRRLVVTAAMWASPQIRSRDGSCWQWRGRRCVAVQRQAELIVIRQVNSARRRLAW
jgi:hypothetical protein